MPLEFDDHEELDALWDQFEQEEEHSNTAWLSKSTVKARARMIELFQKLCGTTYSPETIRKQLCVGDSKSNQCVEKFLN